tara:strand:+ start:3523 stop:4158 length:636 start_codon:yes stop_codon:yes gene_type:complete
MYYTVDFTDTRDDDLYKLYQDTPTSMKNTAFKNMERLWHQADFSWIYQEKCREFLLDKKNLIKISTLVDLGCGKGHALLKFSNNWGFNKIIGVELNEKYFQICKKNIKAVENKHPNYINTQIEVKNMNASRFVFTPDINFLYLFNPFGRKTLGKVIDNIIDSLKKFPREFYVIYRNAIHLKEFLKRNFVVIHQQDDKECIILKYTYVSLKN